MNINHSERTSNGKNLLLIFENKRLTAFEKVERLINQFASFGYYFDKIDRIAYNDSEEIVRALRDGAERFENLILFCPTSMGKTLTDYLSSLLGVPFDSLGTASCGKIGAFVLFSDGQNRLTCEDIKRALDSKYGVRYDRCVVRAVGAPQQALEQAVSKASAVFGSTPSAESVRFNLTQRFGDCRIEMVYSDLTPKMRIDDALREIVKELGDYVYALEDVTLAEQLFRLLKLRRMKISVAESFTGGGVCGKLVEVPGVSEVFFEGLNTYSNRAKMQRLGVDEMTLKQKGAVSAETACQMAEGLLRSGDCDVAVATTGIAGPKSDDTQKPVGLAYIAVGLGNDVAVYKFNFSGDRQTVTQTAINQALFLAYRRLK